MRLSDVKGERAFAILPEIIDAVAAIANDPTAAAMIKPIVQPEGTTWEEYKLVWLGEISSKVVRPHKKQLAKIFSAIRGVSVKEYMDASNLDSLLCDVIDMVQDPLFRELFFSQGQGDSTSSGSATGNTGEQGS